MRGLLCEERRGRRIIATAETCLRCRLHGDRRRPSVVGTAAGQRSRRPSPTVAGFRSDGGYVLVRVRNWNTPSPLWRLLREHACCRPAGPRHDQRSRVYRAMLCVTSLLISFFSFFFGAYAIAPAAARFRRPSRRPQCCRAMPTRTDRHASSNSVGKW